MAKIAAAFPLCTATAILNLHEMMNIWTQALSFLVCSEVLPSSLIMSLLYGHTRLNLHELQLIQAGCFVSLRRDILSSSITI